MQKRRHHKLSLKQEKCAQIKDYTEVFFVNLLFESRNVTEGMDGPDVKGIKKQKADLSVQDVVSLHWPA